ncbi:hypothetical protein TRIP_C20343 [Candidatus Zixiibacteriota bacterium]|nr:hypothetical protein TRIP_C20343 [candidate division Zixibacteria bacterium]
MEIILAIMGVIIGLFSFLYALKTQREKRKFERLVKSNLAGLAGSIVMIRNNPALAHKNIDYILKHLDVIESTPELNRILNRLAWAQGDSAAAHRLLEVLLNDVLTLQEGLFGTRDIVRPDSHEEGNVTNEVEGAS